MTSSLLPSWLVPDTEHLGVLLVRIALTILGALVLQRLGFLLVWRAEQWMVRATQGREAGIQRARTLALTTRHLITTVVFAGAFVHVLEVFGWDIKPLLVGASILGAALGFGAQFLVRDVIAGAFILIEDQFSVGDNIDVNGQVATVEAVTLRSTRLRDFTGRLLFVPNGEMKVVANLSRDWSLALVDLPLAPNQDLGRALDVAEGVAAQVNTDPALKEFLLEPMHVTGLVRLGADGVLLRMTAKAPPGAGAAAVTREGRRRALERLRQAGLRVAGATEVSFVAPGAGPAGTVNP